MGDDGTVGAMYMKRAGVPSLTNGGGDCAIQCMCFTRARFEYRNGWLRRWRKNEIEQMGRLEGGMRVEVGEAGDTPVQSRLYWSKRL